MDKVKVSKTIDKTAEDNIREYHDKLYEVKWDRKRSAQDRYAAATEATGIENTLRFLGIEIEGVNDY